MSLKENGVKNEQELTQGHVMDSMWRLTTAGKNGAVVMKTAEHDIPVYGLLWTLTSGSRMSPNEIHQEKRKGEDKW